MEYYYHNTHGRCFRPRVFLFSVPLFAACAKPPLAEMESARDAVFRAENDSNAVQYGSNSLAQARDALRRMQDEADSKNYDSAKTFAEDAIQAANKAIADGSDGARRARDETAAFLLGLRPAIEETERSINNARYSRVALDYDSLYRDLNAARDAADQAEVAHAMGRYNEAMERGRTVRSLLFIINEKLTNAVTAASGKK